MSGGTIIPASIARNKGRDFFLWYIYGVALFIFALIHSLVLDPDEALLEKRKIENLDFKKCPQCAELTRVDAKICRFCHADVSGISSSPPVIQPVLHEPEKKSDQITKQNFEKEQFSKFMVGFFICATILTITLYMITKLHS